MVDFPYPPWIREITTLMSACAHFVLSGNVHDQFYGPSGRTAELPEIDNLPELVGRALIERGLRIVIAYEVNVGASVLRLGGITPEEAHEVLGGDPATLATPGRINDLRDLVAAVGRASEPVGLVVESASRLVRNPAALTDEEFSFFRGVDRMARTSLVRPARSGARLHSPVVWVVDSERDLPQWFTIGNHALRSISVPLPHVGERERLATDLLPLVARSTQPGAALERPIRSLVEQTSGAPLVAVRGAVQIALDLGLGPDRIEDAARSYRVGIPENPWKTEFVVRRLRDELGEKAEPLADGRTRLAQRVLGQENAVAKVLDILARSAAGLTAAQSGSSATRPRGVLFFAGPTGVGKTELAKAITKLLFDDERFYIRFDMSEFSAEHSADRLIGAPPGYVGHDAGGELTNAIRQRPFSVVLFDEIEKAHERILDKFLQVLDDGRLTDGRGETVFFTEAVVVFTSNLGAYTEVREVLDGREVISRVPAVTPESHPTAELRARVVKQAIRDHFTLRLGRPELLNRIGDDNIVVFDFIDDATAVRILDGMLDQVIRRVREQHGIDISLALSTKSLLHAACTAQDVLAMGGRGIGSKLETALVNPLARLLTLGDERSGGQLLLSEGEGRWTAQWM